MSKQEKTIRYKDALIFTSGKRFFQGEATTLPDGKIQVYIYFDEGTSFKVGDTIPIQNILVDPASKEDLSPDVSSDPVEL